MKENDEISQINYSYLNKIRNGNNERVIKNSFNTNYGKTEVIDGTAKVANTITKFAENAKRIEICAESLWPEELILYHFGNSDNFKNAKKIRFVTEITEQNIQKCKEAMQYAEVRHLDGVKGNFAISDTEYIAASTLFENRKLQQILYSNSHIILEQQQYVFDTFWRNATPAEQKFRDVADKSYKPEHTVVIRDPKEFIKMVRTVTESTRKEMAMIFASANSFRKAIGFVDFDIYSRLIKEKGVNIKVLIIGSTEKETRKAIERENSIRQQENQTQTDEVREILNYAKGKMPDIRFGFIEGRREDIGVSIVIADGSESIIWEEDDNDDNDNGSKERDNIGIRMAIYSNNKPIAWAYHVIFNSLWEQHHMNIDLEKANEKLAEHDKRQSEFINIAAHEIRTPTQKILGYLEMAEAYPDERIFVANAYRNAVRLQKLTEDLLNVAKIESNTLKLNKEKIEVNEIVLSIIRDAQNTITEERENTLEENAGGEMGETKPVQILFSKFNYEGSIYLYVDRTKIMQAISNLLNNALVFTKRGTINIIIEKRQRREEGREDDKGERIVREILIKIKDTGHGIDRQIHNKLFEKFATTSYSGTGLGLYISKNIIEAHGGRIWAENNKEGGATFSFTLPLEEIDKQPL